MSFREEVMQTLIERALNEKDPDKRALKELKRDLVQVLIKYCEPNPGAVETYEHRQAHFMIALAEFLGMNIGGAVEDAHAHEALVHLFQTAATSAGLELQIKRIEQTRKRQR
jgi:septum formation topological specificity factor MinE